MKENNIVIFILGGFFGWIFEQLQNLGVRKFDSFFQSFTGYNIPFLPIYGFGAIILVYISKLLKGFNIFLKSFIHAIILSAFELISGWLLLELFNQSYWNYSGELFNIGGFIYIGSFIAWFIIALVFEYFERKKK